MAKVQILQSVSGAHFSWLPGQVVEMPDAEAEKWADGERGVLAPDDAIVNQTYDPDALVIAEVLVPDLGSDPDLEPHGQLAPKTDPGSAGDDDKGAEPKRNASRGAWVEFALAQEGVVEADLEDLTRDELVEKFATPADDPDA